MSTLKMHTLRSFYRLRHLPAVRILARDCVNLTEILSPVPVQPESFRVWCEGRFDDGIFLAAVMTHGQSRDRIVGLLQGRQELSEDLALCPTATIDFVYLDELQTSLMKSTVCNVLLFSLVNDTLTDQAYVYGGSGNEWVAVRGLVDQEPAYFSLRDSQLLQMPSAKKR